MYQQLLAPALLHQLLGYWANGWLIVGWCWAIGISITHNLAAK